MSSSLIGVDAPLERIERLLADARAGRSGALVLLGEAGIGKSALMDHAAAAAHDRTVLRGRAVEAERDLPFAGLGELLRPLRPLRAELEAQDAAVLDAALGPAGPVAAARPAGVAGVPVAGPAEPPAPFAVAAATLALLSLAADRADGLVVLADDVHWLDDESLDALAFAARRLYAEGVAVLLAARPEPDRGLAARGLEVHELEGLAPADAETLLRSVTEGDLAEQPLRRMLDAAQGNPLALVELSRALTREQRGGAAPLQEPLRPSTAIDRAFRAQLAALDTATVRALLVPAADERLPLARVVEALALLDLPADALEPAERVGVVRAEGGRLHFRHPLLRAVAYHAAPFAQRAAAHRALAAVCGGQEDALRRAWHLAAAADGPDETAAAALDAAGSDAHARGAVASAAHALQRAAELTPDPARRALRMLAAMRDFSAVGQLQQAGALAAEALALGIADPLVRADVRRLQAQVTVRSGQLEAGIAIVLATADELAPPGEPALDGGRATELLLDVALPYRIVGDYGGIRRVVARARGLADPAHPEHAALVDVVDAIQLANTGREHAADAAIARHAQLLTGPVGAGITQELIATAAHVSIWTERFDRAEAICGSLIARARERSAVGSLVYPLAVRAQLSLRRGRLATAYSDGSEALRLAFDTRQFALVALAAGLLADVEAALGREDDCREHAAQSLGICDAIGAEAMGLWARRALGVLELGLGRPEEALPPLEACARSAERIGMTAPGVAQWAADLIEALERSGRRDEAAALLPRLEAGDGSAWARAAVLRCRGLLAEGDDGAGELAAAVDAFERAGLAFEAARTRLCLGERLRRGRQRRRAREPLQAALAAFEAGGAAPWAARAREELRATGLSAAPQVASTAIEELTPHELRVALLVAEGRTNLEVARELYVTRKTVEHHLSQIYRKLGLRSRTELARELAGRHGLVA